MTGTALKNKAIRLFGQENWRSELAFRLKCDRTTIWRYAVGETMIPWLVEIAVDGWIAKLDARSGRRRRR